MTILAATLACGILCVLGLFQLLLAAGAPLGSLAWGGKHRVLPQRLKLASLVSTIPYALIAVVLLDRAKVISLLPPSVSQVATWVIVGFFVLGAVPNLLSPSAPERYVMAPVALLLAGLCIVVGLG